MDCEASFLVALGCFYGASYLRFHVLAINYSIVQVGIQVESNHQSFAGCFQSSWQVIKNSSQVEQAHCSLSSCLPISPLNFVPGFSLVLSQPLS